MQALIMLQKQSIHGIVILKRKQDSLFAESGKSGVMRFQNKNGNN